MRDPPAREAAPKAVAPVAAPKGDGVEPKAGVEAAEGMGRGEGERGEEESGGTTRGEVMNEVGVC